MADLVVELYGTQVGSLAGTWRSFDFVASPPAVETFGLDSLVLSVAIPLAAVPIRSRRERRQNFFRELLPEGRMRTRLAQTAGVPEHDVVGLLSAYGRDVAGALQIWDPEVPGEPREPAIEPLTTRDVAKMLANVSDNPLGNRPVGGKTSLAGVQDKIVLVREQNRWNRAIDGYPSTHIAKPPSRDYPTVIYDEEYGARLARAIGLSSFESWIDDFDGMPALVIERYDRSVGAPPSRIHQEDFNQALGAGGDQKYQKHGGKVSFARIAEVLRAVADRASIDRLLRMLVLAVAVGNLDLHAKNVSLVHQRDGSITLAPSYDVVPQAHQPTDGEMALAVGGEYRHRALTRAHLVGEGQTWGIANAERIVDEALAFLRKTVAAEAPLPGSHPGLAEDVTRFVSNLIAGRAAGDE